MEPGAEGRLLEVRFRARADELRAVRDAVRARSEACGCSPEAASDIVLAVDEACQNVIRHAYAGDPAGIIILEIERQGETLVFSLRDFAPRTDPEKVKPRDLDDLRPGGLGTHFTIPAVTSSESTSTRWFTTRASCAI